MPILKPFEIFDKANHFISSWGFITIACKDDKMKDKSNALSKRFPLFNA